MVVRRFSLMVLATLVSTSAFAKASDTNYILRLTANAHVAKTFDLASCLNAEASSCNTIGEELTIGDLGQITNQLRMQRNVRVAGLGGSIVIGAMALVATGAITYVVTGAARSLVNGAVAQAGELFWAGIMAPSFTYGALVGGEVSGATAVALASSGPILWSSAGHYAVAGKLDAINPTAYNRALSAVLEAQKESEDQTIDGKSLTKLIKAIRGLQEYKEKAATSAYDSIDVFSMLESR